MLSHFFFPLREYPTSRKSERRQHLPASSWGKTLLGVPRRREYRWPAYSTIVAASPSGSNESRSLLSQQRPAPFAGGDRQGGGDQQEENDQVLKGPG